MDIWKWYDWTWPESGLVVQLGWKWRCWSAAHSGEAPRRFGRARNDANRGKLGQQWPPDLSRDGCEQRNDHGKLPVARRRLLRGIMPILTVLANDQGEVVGTATKQSQGRGTGLPGQISLVARPGQQVIEIEVSEEVLNLDPQRLHEFIQVNYLRPGVEAVSSGGHPISQDDHGGRPHKKPNSPNEDHHLVITPAGPRPRDRVHAVRPAEAVSRNPDGTYTVAPTSPDAKRTRRTRSRKQPR